uniref:Uncharacterized protein n=1 Tax=uncultured marine virus TaxID=186617 RepID=A0A0F7LB31_9VIRU|nr:hypothetical protein [uncultured marine virus]
MNLNYLMLDYLKKLTTYKSQKNNYLIYMLCSKTLHLMARLITQIHLTLEITQLILCSINKQKQSMFNLLH